jgi:hypothetical protein
MAESKAHHATDGRSELEGQVKADATPTRPGATPPGSTRAGAPTSVEHTEPEEQFESPGGSSNSSVRSWRKTSQVAPVRQSGIRKR